MSGLTVVHNSFIHFFLVLGWKELFVSVLLLNLVLFCTPFIVKEHTCPHLSFLTL